jgi:hypothetical protein
MAIHPGLRTAILAAVNDLQTATLIPATISLEALAGACWATNATCAQVSVAEIMSELLHILSPHAIAVADNKFVHWGYTQAEVHAFS